jgi:hypothetical protein
MSYASWSVVFGEQPSAAKWNILGTNDASFNDGTGIADSKILPRHLLTGTGSTDWVWTSYAPTLTNASIGNGTITTRYIQHGKTIFYRGTLIWGSTSSISGTITLSLPITMSSAITLSGVEPIGFATLYDAAIAQYPALIYGLTSTTMGFQPFNATGTYATTSQPANATVPFAWNTSDGIEWNVTYQAA